MRLAMYDLVLRIFCSIKDTAAAWRDKLLHLPNREVQLACNISRIGCEFELLRQIHHRPCVVALVGYRLKSSQSASATANCFIGRKSQHGHQHMYHHLPPIRVRRFLCFQVDFTGRLPWQSKLPMHHHYEDPCTILQRLCSFECPQLLKFVTLGEEVMIKRKQGCY